MDHQHGVVDDPKHAPLDAVERVELISFKKRCELAEEAADNWAKIYREEHAARLEMQRDRDIWDRAYHADHRRLAATSRVVSAAVTIRSQLHAGVRAPLLQPLCGALKNLEALGDFQTGGVVGAPSWASPGSRPADCGRNTEDGSPRVTEATLSRREEHLQAARRIQTATAQRWRVLYRTEHRRRLLCQLFQLEQREQLRFHERIFSAAATARTGHESGGPTLLQPLFDALDDLEAVRGDEERAVDECSAAPPGESEGAPPKAPGG